MSIFSKENDIELGNKYRDSVTGIEGVAVGRTSWLTGCDSIGLATVKDGEQLTNWFDIGRLEGIAPPEKPGGPQPVPQKGNRF